MRVAEIMNDTLIVLNIGNNKELVAATVESMSYLDNREKFDFFYIIAKKKNDPEDVFALLHKYGFPVTDNYYIDDGGTWATNLILASSKFMKGKYTWLVSIDADNILNPDCIDVMKDVYTKASTIKPIGIVNSHYTNQTFRNCWEQIHDDISVTDYCHGSTMLFNRTTFIYPNNGGKAERFETSLFKRYRSEGFYFARPLISASIHIGKEGLQMTPKKWRRDKGGIGFDPHEYIKHLYKKHYPSINMVMSICGRPQYTALTLESLSRSIGVKEVLLNAVIAPVPKFSYKDAVNLLNKYSFFNEAVEETEYHNNASGMAYNCYKLLSNMAPARWYIFIENDILFTNNWLEELECLKCHSSAVSNKGVYWGMQTHGRFNVSSMKHYIVKSAGDSQFIAMDNVILNKCLSYGKSSWDGEKKGWCKRVFLDMYDEGYLHIAPRKVFIKHIGHYGFNNKGYTQLNNRNYISDPTILDLEKQAELINEFTWK